MMCSGIPVGCVVGRGRSSGLPATDGRPAVLPDKQSVGVGSTLRYCPASTVSAA
ncbi:hypothetical protein B0G77_8055 [Paraburkholderia sp. BL10I2N1]|nr:hypothetical protein B0G77_8055 [Paraburkholderia sp. BL10I2N1]